MKQVQLVGVGMLLLARDGLRSGTEKERQREMYGDGVGQQNCNRLRLATNVGTNQLNKSFFFLQANLPLIPRLINPNLTFLSIRR